MLGQWQLDASVVLERAIAHQRHGSLTPACHIDFIFGLNILYGKNGYLTAIYRF